MPYQLTIKNKASLSHSPYFQLQPPSMLSSVPTPLHIKAKSKDNEIGLLKHQLRVAREQSTEYKSLCKQLEDQLSASDWEREEQDQSTNDLVEQWQNKLLEAEQALISLQNQLQRKEAQHLQELQQYQSRCKEKSELRASMEQQLLLARTRALLLQKEREELCAKIEQLKRQHQLL